MQQPQLPAVGLRDISTLARLNRNCFLFLTDLTLSLGDISYQLNQISRIVHVAFVPSNVHRDRSVVIKALGVNL